MGGPTGSNRNSKQPVILRGGRPAAVDFSPQFGDGDFFRTTAPQNRRFDESTVFERPYDAGVRIDHDNLLNPPTLIEAAFPQHSRKRIVRGKDLYDDGEGARGVGFR